MNIFLTYDELVDMLFTSFKQDILTNIKSHTHDKNEYINSYCEYMLSVRDLIFNKNSKISNAYLDALLKVKLILS